MSEINIRRFIQFIRRKISQNRNRTGGNAVRKSRVFCTAIFFRVKQRGVYVDGINFKYTGRDRVFARVCSRVRFTCTFRQFGDRRFRRGILWTNFASRDAWYRYPRPKFSLAATRPRLQGTVYRLPNKRLSVFEGISPRLRKYPASG